MIQAWPSSAPTAVNYSPALEAELGRLEAHIRSLPPLADRTPPRWLAVQLLEGDLALLDALPPPARESLRAAVAASVARLEPAYGADIDLALTDGRYAFVQDIVSQVLTAPRGASTLSDRIDRVITHRWLGIPLFLVLMYLVFSLVQNVSAPYLDWVDGVIGGPFSAWVVRLLIGLQAPGWLQSLVVEGAIAGVGGVLTFLPGLLVMYAALGVLEDSGYLARAAFVMDRTMSRMGLHGRSFVPMILGFGCNVPAIYATRTIESRGARLLTGLLIPFMSCSARLPVYVIFGLAFFPRHGQLVIWSLYVLGTLVAAAVGVVLSRTVFRQEPAGILVMEMPAYRWPSARRVWRTTRTESMAFVRKAGSFILAGTLVFWLLLHLPWGTSTPRHSLFGRLSAGVAPALTPAGFGEWEASGALLTGVLAKEMVVATLAQVYVGAAEGGALDMAPIDGPVLPAVLSDAGQVVAGFGQATVAAGQQLLETLTPGVSLFAGDDAGLETSLTAVLRRRFTPLSALSFLVFVLLYVPCLATLAAQAQEFGWRWAGLSVAVTVVIPWSLATLVYQTGRLLGAA